jgi:hypothetical protein
MWMAGGGAKGGTIYGETDDFSYNIVRDPSTSATSTPPCSTCSASTTSASPSSSRASTSASPASNPAPHVLARRLSLDLTGLPVTGPPPAGETPSDYEAHLDSLLASPHFGERMAVWWLDIARFADTVGFHGDQNQRIFPYRDYVINAFHTNKRFDEFTREQLAGDLLPESHQ